MTLSRRNIITGGDGIWVDELNARITQNNDAMKEDFLYYLTESPVTGTRGYAKILQQNSSSVCRATTMPPPPAT